MLSIFIEYLEEIEGSSTYVVDNPKLETGPVLVFNMLLAAII